MIGQRRIERKRLRCNGGFISGVLYNMVLWRRSCRWFWDWAWAFRFACDFHQEPSKCDLLSSSWPSSKRWKHYRKKMRGRCPCSLQVSLRDEIFKHLHRLWQPEAEQKRQEQWASVAWNSICAKAVSENCQDAATVAEVVNLLGHWQASLVGACGLRVISCVEILHRLQIGQHLVHAHMKTRHLNNCESRPGRGASAHCTAGLGCNLGSHLKLYKGHFHITKQQVRPSAGNSLFGGQADDSDTLKVQSSLRPRNHQARPWHFFCRRMCSCMYSMPHLWFREFLQGNTLARQEGERRGCQAVLT